MTAPPPAGDWPPGRRRRPTANGSPGHPAVPGLAGFSAGRHRQRPDTRCVGARAATHRTVQCRGQRLHTDEPAGPRIHGHFTALRGGGPVPSPAQRPPSIGSTAFYMTPPLTPQAVDAITNPVRSRHQASARSIPVSRTTFDAGQRRYLASLLRPCTTYAPHGANLRLSGPLLPDGKTAMKQDDTTASDAPDERRDEPPRLMRPCGISRADMLEILKDRDRRH
jgi:hypothetical protein